MKLFLFALLASFIAAGPNAAIALEQQPAQPQHSETYKYEDLKWEKLFPELGDKSAEITTLRVDPKTKATQLMIRMPANFHVPKHWHTANETITILSGTFTIECEGKRDALGAKSSNFLPSKMVHEGWAGDDEVVILVTGDAPWDINWVAGPPKPEDLIGGVKG